MYLRFAIALISAAAIAFEVLLMRIFSIIQWHHFAAMIISLALLGYGASGALLAGIHQWLMAGHPRRWQAVFVVSASLFGVLVLGCTTVAQWIDFNPLALVWEPEQLGPLFALFLLLAVPFFLAATAIGVALTFRRRRIAGIYGADLLGAGAGSLGILGLMYLFPLTTNLRLIAVLGLLAAGVGALEWRLQDSNRKLLTLPVVGLLIVSIWPQEWQMLRLSEYKALRKALLVPGAEVIAELNSPLGMLTQVASPTIPFRHAPGLSLSYVGDLPSQLAIFVDGESMTVIDTADSVLEEEYLDYLPAALPYHLMERPSVLNLGTATNSDLLLALRHDASHVQVVEFNAQLVELVLDPRNGRVGEILGGPPIEIEIAEPRSFVHRETRRYDLIQIPLAGGGGTAASGNRSFGTNHLFTVEAVAALLERLKPDGMLVMSLWLRIPPRENLRLFATVVEALTRRGAPEPSRQLIQIRGWGTVTTVVKNSAFHVSEIVATNEFCNDRSFDVTHFPGMTGELANRFNRLDEPYLYLGNRAILDDPAAFFAAYKFAIRPATDDHPFFFHTFKWKSLLELLELAGRAGVPMVEWAYLVVVATVLQAAVAAGLLILLPLRWVGRHGPRAHGWRVPVYFASLGLAFMLVEIGLFQRFALYLGHPIHSVAIVLGGFLIFAGLGSLFTREPKAGQALRSSSPRVSTALIVLLGLLYFLLLPSFLAATISLPLWARAQIALAVLAPIGFLMGMPFPLGLTRAAERQVIWVPWAWGINGSASVVGAAAAPLVALHFGISAVILVGVVGYLAAMVSYGSGFDQSETRALQGE